jgi:hypothetical protein
VAIDFRVLTGASGVLGENGFKACLPSATTPVLSLAVDRIDASPAATEAYHSPELRAIEGEDGHTLRRHVAQSDQALHDRAVRTHHDVSTFDDAGTAQQTVDAAFAENQGKIARWMSANRSGNLDLHVHFDRSIGRVFRYDTDAIQPSADADVILEHRPALPAGYTVITAYPSAR